MANSKNTSDPIVPLSVIVDLFVAQTHNDIMFNFIKQQVYPTEIYPGYNEINEMRKSKHEWYSTGEGEKTLTVEGHAKDNPDNLHIDVKFNDYLRYVDIGAGGHTKASDVDRSKKAKFDQRYINHWIRPEGKSHRPIIMRSVLRLRERLARYLEEYYGHRGEVPILHTFEGFPKVEL